MTPRPLPFYLVRHGQSEWNLARLTQGQTAHPRLTALGREQAAAAAELIAADLDGAAVARVVTSDLTRAVETAEIVAARVGGELVLDRRLREQHLGRLEGLPYEESWAENHDWSDPALPVAGGESPRDVRDRIAAALSALDRSAVAVLVSHGDAIRTAVASFAGLGLHEAPWVDVPNGAVARVDDGVAWLR